MPGYNRVLSNKLDNFRNTPHGVGERLRALPRANTQVRPYIAV